MSRIEPPPVDQSLTVLIYRRHYNTTKTHLFFLVSLKLGRTESPLTASEIIRTINEISFIYFLRSMWEIMTRQKYFPLSYVVWVTGFLCAAAPAIYAGLSACEQTPWMVLGTVTAIVCDIIEVMAIAFTIIFTADTAREVLCQLILPIMGIVKFTGKLAKVGGKLLTVEAAGEVAGEAVLMFSRFVAVIHSQPTWNVAVGHRSAPGVGGNWLTREEELIVMGLVLEHRRR